jgi:hypothetical protein
MRKLLIFVLVLGALALAGDSILRGFAERKAADQLRTALSLSDTPSVGIGGWPFALRVLAQSFPSVDVTGRDVIIEGLTVATFDLRLRDVEFSGRDLLAGEARSIKIGAGRGSLRLTSEAISKRLGAENLPFELSIDGDQATVSSPQLGASVSADISLSGRSLTIDPPGLDPVSLQLPQVADEVEYRSVRISGDEVVATFGLRAGTIDLTD